MKDCREADKQLITPYQRRIRTDIIQDPTRLELAFSYAIGCYNPQNNKAYYYKYSLNRRLFSDILVSLPLCVFEGNSGCLRRNIRVLIRINCEHLPIPKTYHILLNDLLQDTVNGLLLDM